MTDQKIKIKLKNKLDFKDYIFHNILTKINGDYAQNDCTGWIGYCEKHKHYSQACYIVYLKNGNKHFINPQKYIYNYLKNPDITYNQLITMKNRVRNIDDCRKRGICCCLNHLESY